MSAGAVGQRIGRLAVDLVLLAVAAITALALRENATLEADKLTALIPYLTVSTALAIPVSLALGLDRAFWRFSALADFIKVLTWISFTVLAATVLVFVYNRLDGVSRSTPILHVLVAVCLLVGTRVMVRARHLSQSRRPNPALIARPGSVARDDCVLIVGVNDLTWLFLRALGELDQDNVRIAGIVATTPRPNRQTVRGHRIYGADEHVPDIIRSLMVHGVRVQRIIVTVDPASLPEELAESLNAIAGQGQVRVETLFDLIGLRSRGLARRADVSIGPPGMAKAASARIAGFFPSEGLDTVSIANRPFWKVKRTGDFLVAAVLLVALAPLTLAVGCAVAIWIGRPLIFWQDRPGRGGRRFRLYKFRTMGPAHGADGKTLADDQRLNWLGQFLRMTRLDELPQLWNILAGDMSFVGPRPLLLADQVEGETVRLLVRPGLTGWAQVMGGRSVSATDKMALDAWYIRNASLLLDLKIVCKTLPIIIGGERITSEAKRAWEVAAASATSRPDGHGATSESARASMHGLGERVGSIGG